MIYAIRFSVISIVAVLFACNIKQDSDPSYYPVVNFFTQEIAAIDTLPLAIFHVKIEKDHSDTSIFPKEEFRKMTNSFFIHELKEMNAENGFKETVIHDEQLKETTLSYIKEDSNPGLFKIELHIRDGESIVHSVYMERIDKEKDLEISRKILWLAGKEMIVQSMAYSNGNAVENRSDRFRWSVEN